MIKLNQVLVVIYPTFAIINHASEIANKVYSLSSETTEVLAVFENSLLYDFEYYGFNIRTSYLKLRDMLAAHRIKVADLSENCLDGYVCQEINTNKICLMIPNVQQVRSFQIILSPELKKNIVGITIFDYTTNTLRDVNIYTVLHNPNDKIIPFSSSTRLYSSALEQNFKINIQDYRIDDSHSTSIVYIPIDSSPHLFKTLRGNYPNVWVDKVTKFTLIRSFLDSNRIPHALPEVTSNGDIHIFKEHFIDGITLYKLVGHKGIVENLGDDNRKTIASFLLELSRAVYFYHFLGIYISDVKEDNFFYYKDQVIPIDSDGFSIDIYPSSQPRVEYRGKTLIENAQLYYHSAETEAYSLSFLIFKVFFNNMAPLDFKDCDKNITSWCNKKNDGTLSQRETAKLNFWFALPIYIRAVFLFLFSEKPNELSHFFCDQWNEILQAYLVDLNSPQAILDYYNKKGVEFPPMSFYSIGKPIRYRQRMPVIKDNNKTAILIRVRNALLLANGLSLIAIIIMLIKVFLL